MTNLFHMPIATALDSSGAAAATAKLYFYADGTSTPLDTYSDSQLSNTNTNPVLSDAAGRFGAIYLKNDQQYKVILKDSSDNELWSVDDVSGADAGTYAADTGAANAYVITLDPPPSSYFEGMELNTKILNTSTGASTINVNALGTVAIQQLGSATVTGSLTAGDMVKLIHTGTVFEIISPSRTLTVSDNSISGDKIQGGALESDTAFIGGIGTPDGTLHVHTATAGTIIAATTADDLVVEMGVAGGLTFLSPNTVTVTIAVGDPEDNDIGKIVYSHSANSWAFTANASLAMTINDSGNVSIGAATANAAWAEHDVLHLGVQGIIAARTGATNLETGSNFYKTASTTYKYATTDQMGVLTMANGDFIFKAAASGTADTTATLVDNLTVLQNGQVGVGISAPDGTLHVHTATAGAVGADANADDLVVENSGNAGITVLTPNTAKGSVSFGDEDDGNNSGIDYNHATNIFRIINNTSVSVQIDDNDNFMVGGITAAASSVNNLHLYNGTAPSAGVAGGGVLYSEDVTASAEFKVMDEAGNSTTLSPHNFSLIPNGPSEDMAWAYYSERGGRKVNVDMLKLARLVEQISGEKLVYEA